MLLPFQQRVVDERDALVSKIYNLTVFLRDTEKTSRVDSHELSRLRTQNFIMQAYCEILNQRILNFQ